MLVSFIVPVYKVEKYLMQCVESILKQTYENIEVILVDDGSPDSCPILCDKLAAEDDRIKVLHKANGGLSDARNAGLKVATGDYVVFMDSDDFWVGNDSLQKLVDIIRKNPDCDFYGFNCSYYYPSIGTYCKWVMYDDALSRPTDRSTAMRLLVASGTMPMSACLKIISRKLLVNKCIVFEKGLLSEDIPWFINLLDACDKCMFVNLYIYAYRQEVSGSITKNFSTKHFDDILHIIRRELELLDKRNFDESSKDYLRSFLAYELSILLSKIPMMDAGIRYAKRKELHPYKWLLHYTQNPKVGMVNLVYRLLGIRITEIVLSIYEKSRAKKQ